jgi:guanylate kinase
MIRENRGMLIVISGPAGSGKGTVVKELRSQLPNLGLSVSATTRSPRPGEEDGVHYYFMSRDDFEEALSHGEILEHTVYCGNYYGTLRSEVERVLSGGHDLILEIEADGAMQVKRLFPDTITIMLIPPDSQVLEARLRGRGTETDDVILARLRRAREEIVISEKYDYIVVNKDNGVEECARDIAGILAAEHLRAPRMKSVTSRFFGEE